MSDTNDYLMESPVCLFTIIIILRADYTVLVSNVNIHSMCF
jgi:hypothetical protein